MGAEVGRGASLSGSAAPAAPLAPLAPLAARFGASLVTRAGSCAPAQAAEMARPASGRSTPARGRARRGDGVGITGPLGWRGWRRTLAGRAPRRQRAGNAR